MPVSRLNDRLKWLWSLNPAARLAQALLNYGQRVQESVFVANLDEELVAKMRSRVAKLVEERLDRVHIFELCGACVKKTQVFGTADVVEDREFYVI